MSGFADWEFWLKMGTLGKLYNFPEYFAHYALWEGGGSFGQQKVNTQTSVRIVRKYRGEYRWYLPALLLAYMPFTVCQPASGLPAFFVCMALLSQEGACQRLTEHFQRSLHFYFAATTLHGQYYYLLTNL